MRENASLLAVVHDLASELRSLIGALSLISNAFEEDQAPRGAKPRSFITPRTAENAPAKEAAAVKAIFQPLWYQVQY
eukprot:4616508-Pyramimonas_sp.AAC.2